MERSRTQSGSINVQSTSFQARKTVEQARRHLVSVTFTRSKPLPSRISRLLCSNESPTETDLPIILETISRAQAKADRLAASIASKRPVTVGLAKISRKLSQLNLSRVNKTLETYRNILSPIRRIPPEILEYIFALSISQYDLDEIEPCSMSTGLTPSKPYFDHSYVPRLQSQVCKFWRNVALSDPRLWNNIPTIPLNRPYSRHPAFLAYLADILDRRCGGVPINFHVVDNSKTGGSDPHPAITMLVSHSTHWKTAIFGLSLFKGTAFSEIKGRIPLLETLALYDPYLCPPSFLNGPIPMVDIFAFAPQLRKVVLACAEPPTLLLPQHQILHYRNDSTSVHVFEETLKLNSDSLLSLDIGGPIGDAVINNMGGTFSNLTSLKLGLEYYDPRSNIFVRLKLPGLRDLSISSTFTSSGQVSIMTLIIDLILRSGILSLERLHIQSTSREKAGVLTSLLRCVPLITNLTINLPPLEDLVQLAQADDVIAPLLEVCTFHLLDSLSEDEANLCRQIAFSRCESLDDNAPRHRLRALYVEYGVEPFFLGPSYRLLTGWTENSVTANLTAYAGSLFSHVYQLARIPINYDRSILPGQDYYSSVVLSTLSLIEQMEITQGKDIFASQILPRLLHLADLPDHNKSYYIRSLQLILDKWKPLIEASFDDFHWAIRDSLIVYIPCDSPLRKSSDVMTRLMLRKYSEPIPERDRPWQKPTIYC